jgi:hypothetical protein
MADVHVGIRQCTARFEVQGDTQTTIRRSRMGRRGSLRFVIRRIGRTGFEQDAGGRPQKSGGRGRRRDRDPAGDRDQINGTTIQRSRTVQDSDIGNRGDRNRGRRFGVRNNLGGRQIKTDNSDQADRNRGQRSSGRHRRQRFDVQGFGGSQEFLGILGSGSGSRTRDQHSRRSKTVRGISRVLGDLGIRGSGDLKSSWRS